TSPWSKIGPISPGSRRPSHSTQTRSTSRSDRRKFASGSLDLEIHRRGFPAALFDLLLNVLPFVKRSQSSALHCGDVYEHVLASCLGLNETITLSRIEPVVPENPIQRGFAR